MRRPPILISGWRIGSARRSCPGWTRENQTTLSRLQSDPHYPSFYREALAIAAADDRIPIPSLLNGRVFNFWRDADHPQGIWRFTREEDYAAANPSWTTVLDLDALSKAEGRQWVWKGASVLDPGERLALVHLSDGGEDAVTLREFDLQTGTFVEGGFNLPKSKQDVAWLDEDTILLSRDWGEGTTTTSGYPFVVKLFKRGQSLADAREVLRGRPDDQVGTAPFVLSDGSGNRAAFIHRGVTFFGNETFLLDGGVAKKLPLPPKSNVQCMVQGHVLIKTNEDWKTAGVTVPAGAVAALTLKAIEAGGELRPTIVFAPDARQSVQGVTASRSRAILSISDTIRGRILIVEPGTEAWTATPVALPDNTSIAVVATTDRSDKAFLTVTGFLDPTTLWALDAADPKPVQVRALPAQFDASQDVVEQFEATSTDGTKIPYFIVHRKDIALDGSTPAIMTAYGGFRCREHRATTPRWASFGSSVAAVLFWPTSAAAASSVRPGTRPAARPGARSSMTTSPRSPRTSSREGIPAPRGSASMAARMAAC